MGREERGGGAVNVDEEERGSMRMMTMMMLKVTMMLMLMMMMMMMIKLSPRFAFRAAGAQSWASISTSWRDFVVLSRAVKVDEEGRDTECF